MYIGYLRKVIIGAQVLSVCCYFLPCRGHLYIPDLVTRHIPLLYFFAICALYYLNAEKKLSNRVFAALFLGMGVFEHLIFIIVPMVYGMYFFIKDRFRLKIDKGLVAFFAIFSIFLLARLFLIFDARLFNPQGDGIYYSLPQVFNAQLIYKLLNSMPHFMDMLDGGIFYLRTTGDILVKPMPLNSVLFILSFLFILFRYRYYPEFKNQDRMFISVFILNYIISTVFLLELALRYYLITLMFATILTAIFIGTTRMRQWFRIGLAFLIVLLNCLYIGLNYMYSFRQSGGRVSYFWSGNYFENSNGFVDSKILYDYLKEKDIEYTWIPEGPLRWKLIFHDLREKRLNIRARAESISVSKTHFISYKGDRLPHEYGLSTDYSVERETAPLNNYEIFLLQR